MRFDPHGLEPDDTKSGCFETLLFFRCPIGVALDCEGGEESPSPTPAVCESLKTEYSVLRSVCDVFDSVADAEFGNYLGAFAAGKARWVELYDHPPLGVKISQHKSAGKGVVFILPGSGASNVPRTPTGR